MSDPAIEAVQRVKCAAWAFIDPPGAAADVAERAAREALKPIRELHRRVDDGHPSGLPTCEHCRGDWPCSTAALVYSTDELASRVGVARRPKVTG